MIWALHPRSDDRDISENGPSWTVYRNRRSFRSDGYEISPYKKACSSSFLDIRVRIQQNWLSRHLSHSFLSSSSSSSLNSASMEG